jgi:adenine phosphoribosyltransferase
MKNIISEISSKIQVTSFLGVDKFYDISGILADNYIMDVIVDMIISKNSLRYDCVCGIDARGFIFGILVATKLQVPFYMLRKEGKLPNSTNGEKYYKEYHSGKSDSLCISNLADIKDKNVLIIDDSIATGSTMKSAINLIKKLGAMSVKCSVIIKLNLFPDDFSENVYYIVKENDIIKKVINVGTTSSIKIQAIHEIFDSFYVNPIETDSKVNIQPIGFEEIELGANNRIVGIPTPSIGIENGLVCINNIWFDVACIKLHDGTNIHTAWSTLIPVYLPEDYITNGNYTIKTFAEEFNYPNPKDPHSLITAGSLSRKDILKQALSAVYSKLYP